MKSKIGSVTVSVMRGDITDAEVDAIVSAASSDLKMTTGVPGAMKRKGGTVIEEDAIRQGPVELGEAVLTVAGNLNATHVIHAVTMGPDLKTDPDKIAPATTAALVLAEKHRVESIAFPALGSGVGGIPAAKAAEAMLPAIVSHLKSGRSSLQKVVFVVYEDQASKAFTDTLKRLAGLQ